MRTGVRHAVGIALPELPRNHPHAASEPDPGGMRKAEIDLRLLRQITRTHADVEAGLAHPYDPVGYLLRIGTSAHIEAPSEERGAR